MRMARSRFLSRLVPRAIRERRAERRVNDLYRRKVQEAKAAKDSDAVESWESEWASAIWEFESDRRLTAQRRLFRKARRLYVPVPQLTEENSVDGVVVDNSVFEQLVPRIREAQKARHELWLAWVPLVTALTGLIGTLVGMIALLKK
jgi:hypothetical protein